MPLQEGGRSEVQRKIILKNEITIDNNGNEGTATPIITTKTTAAKNNNKVDYNNKNNINNYNNNGYNTNNTFNNKK